MWSQVVEEVLARTARHGSGAWNVAVVGAVLLAVLVLAGMELGAREGGAAGGGCAAPAPETGGLRRVALAGCLAAGVLGAAVGAAALPVLLRLPGALLGHGGARVLSGDRMAIGAIVGFAAAAALAGRAAGLGAWRALDRLAASLGALVVGGRIGCFLEGCDFGVVTAAPWGVRYPAGSFAFEHQLAHGLVRAGDAAALPVWPVQLFEAAVGVVMIGAALRARRHARGRSAGRRPDGGVLRLVVFVYAIGRIGAEVLRGDERGALGALSLPQWLCLAMLAWCASGWLEARGQATASAP